MLNLEKLEHRRVLAAYINEIHFGPLFGSAAEDQYVELRGGRNQTLDPGTYFIGVESADGVDELGDIHTIIDLSNQQFGSNGLMVLLQSSSGYAVDGSARVLQGTDGFLGLPGYIADHASKSIHGGSSSYFLVESLIPPDLADDIDQDDNGVPDGPYVNWDVLDSVSVLPWVETPFEQRTYGQIVFTEDGVGDGFLFGSTVVHTDQLAYVGRIGDSTGYTADEWVAGNTVEATTDGWDFQLQHGVFGTPRPFAYGGRVLDHVGAPNWLGEASGHVFRDDNGDGIFQPEETPIQGIDVFADFNGDGQAGRYWETIEPNDHDPGSDLSNTSSNVTLISAGADNVHQGFKIRAVHPINLPDGENIFAHEGVGFFNENRRMRLDFYEPANAVQIEFIGDSDLTPTYGRLEAFSADDVSLGFLRTEALLQDETQTLTFTSGNDDIAWALAYPEDSYLDSSPFGRLDKLAFELREPRATTSSTGSFHLGPLTRGGYPITIGGATGYEIVMPVGGQHDVNIEHYEFRENIDFALQGDVPPALNNQDLEVGELTAGGSSVVVLPISLGYATQELDITIAEGDPNGNFDVDSESFELLIRKQLDFESTSEHTLELLLTDRNYPELTETATVSVTVIDQNDAPIVADQTIQLTENSASGLLVATAIGTDQDPGVAGEFVWSLGAGNTGEAFSIDAETGEIRINSASEIDFEANPVFEISVLATDGGTPVQVGQGLLRVELSDLNEAPVIPEQTLSVPENTASGILVGQLLVEDRDQDQTITWNVIGGNAAPLFDIAQDGQVTVAESASLDFENHDPLWIEVHAVDSGEPPMGASRTISIELLDRNDPPEIVDQTFSVDENSEAGTVVGTVVASDVDVGQEIGFQISGGPHAHLFEVDSETGQLTVSAGADLDFEQLTEATLEITASDNASTPGASTAVISIQLANVNEAPSIEDMAFEIDENSTSGTRIGQLLAQDPDEGDSQTFTIVSQLPEWLAINATTGELFVAPGAEFDFEANSVVEAVVRVADADGLTADATVSVTTRDVNDPPHIVSPLPDVTTKADETFHWTIPDGAFGDEDSGDALRYSATATDGFSLPDWLSFDPETRTLSGTPSNQEVGVVDVRITAIDQAGASVADDFQIEVETSFPWHNPQNAEDVNGDGFVTPIDALLVINYLNQADSPEVPVDQAADSGLIDVNGDNFVTPLDALLVINDINNGEGEGEASDWPNGQLGSDADQESLFAWLAAERFRLRRQR